tara:strand:+ start:1058 stop:1279 length:222 start_codon:yes stop_codon:yes gene_type:complete
VKVLFAYSFAIVKIKLEFKKKWGKISKACQNGLETPLNLLWVILVKKDMPLLLLEFNPIETNHSKVTSEMLKI